MVMQSLVASVGIPENKQKLVKSLIMGVAVVALVVGAFFAWRFYTARREEAAQATFAQNLVIYNQAQAGKVAWTDVEAAFKNGYEQHSGAYLAPYFIGFQAEALVQQSKLADALVLMDDMLSKLASSSPLYNLYATKRALIKLDGDDQAAGIAELTQLAQDKKNLYNDMAQFYLGSYHWSKNEGAQARQLWQALADSNKDAVSSSPWAVLAADKLEQFV